MVTPNGFRVKGPQTEDVKKSNILEMRSEDYKKLRSQTPTQEVRDSVNPIGPKIDPVYKYHVERLEADHIVSMKEISEMPGFDKLTQKQQLEILNLRDNFLGLGKATNSSKGAKSWADWTGHSRLGEVPSDVKVNMLQLERNAKELILKKITDFEKLNEKGNNLK